MAGNLGPDHATISAIPAAALRVAEGTVHRHPSALQGSRAWRRLVRVPLDGTKMAAHRPRSARRLDRPAGASRAGAGRQVGGAPVRPIRSTASTKGSLRAWPVRRGRPARRAADGDLRRTAVVHLEASHPLASPGPIGLPGRSQAARPPQLIVSRPWRAERIDSRPCAALKGSRRPVDPTTWAVPAASWSSCACPPFPRLGGAPAGNGAADHRHTPARRGLSSAATPMTAGEFRDGEFRCDWQRSDDRA